MKIQDRQIRPIFLTLILAGAFSCKSSDQQPGDRAQIDETEANVSDDASIPTPVAAPIPNPAPVENSVESAKWDKGAELLRAGFAAEGSLIHIQFRLPPRKARRLMQGNVYVVDEASKASYREVPVTPLIGPLLARPRQDGQIGYVMLVNAPVPLKSGAIVTVVLGDYKQEHVRMQ